ncbi:MAG: hypothetical protein ACOCRK_11800, partial [bacterium]
IAQRYKVYDSNDLLRISSCMFFIKARRYNEDKIKNIILDSYGINNEEYYVELCGWEIIKEVIDIREDEEIDDSNDYILSNIEDIKCKEFFDIVSYQD